MVDCRRLFRAQYQDIQIIEQIDTRSYRVSGSQNKVYKVNLNTHSCTCPDWTDQAPRGGCKHILKIKLEHGEMDKLSYLRQLLEHPNRILMQTTGDLSVRECLNWIDGNVRNVIQKGNQ